MVVKSGRMWISSKPGNLNGNVDLQKKSCSAPFHEVVTGASTTRSITTEVLVPAPKRALEKRSQRVKQIEEQNL